MLPFILITSFCVVIAGCVWSGTKSSYLPPSRVFSPVSQPISLRKISCQEDKFHNIKKSMGNLLGIYITEEVTDWSQIREKIKNFFSQAPPNEG